MPLLGFHFFSTAILLFLLGPFCLTSPLNSETKTSKSGEETDSASRLSERFQIEPVRISLPSLSQMPVRIELFSNAPINLIGANRMKPSPAQLQLSGLK